jgi:ribosomal-protein-alanine N-acetyltransferase
MDEVSLRRMNLADVDKVWHVEKRSFGTPWSRQAFVDEMNHELSYYLVLEKTKHIVGYAGMWLIVDEAHITNVAVLPEFRGQGLGARLMFEIKRHARERGAVRMTLEVRASNFVAQKLYSKMGFRQGGIRRNYYRETKEDALIMWCELNEEYPGED